MIEDHDYREPHMVSGTRCVFRTRHSKTLDEPLDASLCGRPIEEHASAHVQQRYWHVTNATTGQSAFMYLRDIETDSRFRGQEPLRIECMMMSDAEYASAAAMSMAILKEMEGRICDSECCGIGDGCCYCGMTGDQILIQMVRLARCRRATSWGKRYEERQAKK